MTSDSTQISRRTVAKGVAWSLPVIATAAAAPAAVASDGGTGDVVISALCHKMDALGLVSVPKFTITAVGQPIGAGSTFTLAGSELLNVRLGGVSGPIEVGLLDGSSRTIELSKDLAPGQTASFRVTGAIAVLVLAEFTLSVGTVIGNADTDKTNNSATQELTGVGLGKDFVGFCGADASKKASVARVKAHAKSLGLPATK